MKIKTTYVIPFVLILTLVSFSCKKNKEFTKNHLDFSTDTLLFDTIFTTIGSTSKNFKIYNNNTSRIKIDEIELMGGANSPFRINVDGLSGTYFSDIEMKSKDSLFAFAEVTLQVNNISNPLVIEDSVRFRTNGLDQYVKLVVWGQDAYFHVNEIVGDFAPWLNDKPHVIYGVAAVGFPGIDSNLTLTIPQGTKVYSHKNSLLYVYKSTLNIQGQLGNEVVFQADRLEPFYQTVAGQWRGILMQQANYSTIEYAIIKNGAIGLQIDTTNGVNTLLLRNTIIDNNEFYNFVVNAGANVTVENCLFGKAGLNSAFLFAGGTSQFTNCHFVNYWSGSRGGPSFLLKNWYKYEGVNIQRDVNCSIFNSVFYGNAQNEFEIDSIYNGSALFNVLVSHCLIRRVEEIYDYPYLQNIIWNQNPLFESVEENNFKFPTTSPLNNAGSSSIFTIQDIEGVSRNGANPDIGIYEIN